VAQDLAGNDYMLRYGNRVVRKIAVKIIALLAVLFANGQASSQGRNSAFSLELDARLQEGKSVKVEANGTIKEYTLSKEQAAKAIPFQRGAPVSPGTVLFKRDGQIFEVPATTGSGTGGTGPRQKD
jgi:hypothetical protein